MSLLDKSYFGKLASSAIERAGTRAHCLVNYAAEDTWFLRVNGARARQAGRVADATLDLAWIARGEGGKVRKSERGVQVTGAEAIDLDRVARAVTELEAEAATLPADPYVEAPTMQAPCLSMREGSLPDPNSAGPKLLERMGNLDLAGILASGPVARGMASSAGFQHWFQTDCFSFDFSAYVPERRAIKAMVAGSQWNWEKLGRELDATSAKLTALRREPRKLLPGTYRAWLAPAAVADLVAMFSWGCVGEAAIRQGDSPLRRIREGGDGFSSRFSLSEDFTEGESPRFNAEGEVAPERLPLIERGALVGSLVSQRSAKEYGVPGNGAEQGEPMRAPSMAAGSLEQDRVLEALGTGIWVSNLHYLNWSDQPGGRVTGMTRYACFWVEKGEIVAPIENLRFDDSIFSLFGGALEAVGADRVFRPTVGTYGFRQIGGSWVPGMLVSGMRFPL